jgi:hypothetical protein
MQAFFVLNIGDQKSDRPCWQQVRVIRQTVLAAGHQSFGKLPAPTRESACC